MATDTLNGLNIVFPIYNEDGTPFHNLVLRKSVVDSIVMSLGDKITGDVFYKDNTLQVTMKEYVEYNGIHFSLVNPPTIVREGMVADNGELKGMTKYSFEFYHPMYQLSNFPFTDIATKTGEEKYLSQNKSFSWIGKPQDYIDKLNKNLQGTIWYVRKSDRFPVEKDDELSDVQQFDNVSVAEAIKRGYEIWGTPYIVSQLTSNDPLYAQGKRFVVEYGLPSNEIYESESARQLDTPYVFQMGQGVGLKNNSRTPRNNKIVTRIAGYGSEDNVPYGYPQIVWTGNQDWDYTINNDQNNPLSYPIYKGIVGGQYVKLIKHPFTRTHLMPSIFTETVNKKVNPNAVGYDPTIEIKDYYDAVATQEYPYVNKINLQAPSYESHEFADIKPELDADRNTGIVSAVPLNADLTPADHWDDSMDDDGNYLQSYFQITLPQLSFDLYACAAITQEMQINMRSGACIGCTFPVQVDWDDYKSNFYDEDGNFVPDGEQRDLTKYPKSNLGQINIIVQKENSTFGTLMPNIYQQPKADDLFVFIGISLPTSYITNAEVRLDAAMKSYMLENNVYYFDYPLKFDEHFLATHTYILEQIRPNSIIHFDYGGVEQQLFVKQLTVKYGNAPLPQYDITLTDNVEVVLNQIGQVADDVEKLSSLIAILRQSYNRNVWIELAKKLSKVSDDTAQGWITVLAGVRTLKDFIESSKGGALYTDEDALAHLTTDVARIRERIQGSLRIGDTALTETEPTLHVGGNTLVDNDIQVGGDLDVTGRERIDRIQSHNYSGSGLADTGYMITSDNGTGSSMAVLDYLTIRKKMIVNSIEVKETHFSAGDIAHTLASCEIAMTDYLYVDENGGEELLGYSRIKVPWLLRGAALVLGVDNGIVRGLYSRYKRMRLTLTEEQLRRCNRIRCYFLSKDGDREIENWFRPNDLVRCQTWNVVRERRETFTPDFNDHAGNVYYWRKIHDVSWNTGETRYVARDSEGQPTDDMTTDVSRAYVNEGGVARLADNGIHSNSVDGAHAPKEIDGNTYHWFDVDYDYAAEQAGGTGSADKGSDIPAAGDKVVQFGNTTDPDRMNIYLIEVNGAGNPDAPDWKMYRGVYTFNLSRCWWGGESCMKTKWSVSTGIEAYAPSFKWITEYGRARQVITREEGFWSSIALERDDWSNYRQLSDYPDYSDDILDSSGNFVSRVNGKPKNWVRKCRYYDQVAHNGSAWLCSRAESFYWRDKDGNMVSSRVEGAEYVRDYTTQEPSAAAGDWTEQVGKGDPGAFKSQVFCRSNSTPSAPSNEKRNGYNTYDNPVPPAVSGQPTWTDGAPGGTAILWMSTAWFYSNGKHSDWTTPRQQTDTETLDVEFSPNATQPSTPAGTAADKDTSSVKAQRHAQGWYDPNDTLPTPWTWSDMVWRAERRIKNGVYYGNWTVSRIKGENSVRIDLSNENDTMLYSSSKGLVSGSVQSTAYLFDGSDDVSDSENTTWQVSASGCTLTSGNSRNIVVTGMTAMTAKVTVTATYTDMNKVMYTRSTQLTLKKIIDGDKYDLDITPSSIAYNVSKDSPGTSELTIRVWRTAVDGTHTMSAPPSGYYVYAGDTRLTASSTGTYSFTTDNSAVSGLQVMIAKSADGTDTLDSETIPVVKAEDGTSPYFADIDNEMHSVACDKNGSTLEDFDLTVGVNLWHGSTPLNLTTLTTDTPEGFTITANKSAKTIRIQVAKGTSIAEVNDIRITVAGSGSGEHSLHFTLNGVRQGENGEPAVLYALVPSVSAVVRKKNGTYSVDSVSCTRQKNVGGVITENATDGEIKYRLDGGNEKSYTNNTDIAVSSFSKSIQFIYRVGGKTVDVETILMVADGEDGKTPTISIGTNGHWIINGTDTGVTAEGKDGTGVAIKGTVASTGKMTIENGKGYAVPMKDDGTDGEKTEAKHGDCYICDSNRHLYMFTTEPAVAWNDLGEFKGEPGKSSYMHIAWADEVTFSGGSYATIKGFIKVYDGNPHDWVGFATDNSAEDPSDWKAYKWNYQRGADGSGTEYVYLLTKEGFKPTLSQTSGSGTPSEDEFLPAVSNYESGKVYGNSQYFEDDPPASVSAEWQVLWWACRKYKDGAWQEFGDVTMHNRYSKDGMSVESYIYTEEAWSNQDSTVNAATPPSDCQESDWSDSTPANVNNRSYLWRRSRKMTLKADKSGYDAGQWAYTRLSGTNGTSIKTQGTVAATSKLLDKEVIPLVNGADGARTAVEDGWAYVCQADRHLYQWSDETRSKSGTWTGWQSGWLDLGEFKGESGKTYYTHVAWARGITIGTPTADRRTGQRTTPNASACEEFSISPQDDLEWMGVLVDEELQDAAGADGWKYYTWNKVQGIPGENSIRLALDNEHEDFIYDGTTLVAPSAGASSPIHLYDGGNDITASMPAPEIHSVSGTTKGTGGAYISNKTLYVKSITASTCEVVVKCTYNESTYYAKFTANKTNQDKYDIVCKPSSIAYNSTTHADKASTATIQTVSLSATGIGIGGTSLSPSLSTSVGAGRLCVFWAPVNSNGMTGGFAPSPVTSKAVTKQECESYAGIFFELRYYTSSSHYRICDYETVEIAKTKDGDSIQGDNGVGLVVNPSSLILNEDSDASGQAYIREANNTATIRLYEGGAAQKITVTKQGATNYTWNGNELTGNGTSQVTMTLNVGNIASGDNVRTGSISLRATSEDGNVVDFSVPFYVNRLQTFSRVIDKGVEKALGEAHVYEMNPDGTVKDSEYLYKQVNSAKGAITTLQNTVGNASGGLVKQVSALEQTAQGITSRVSRTEEKVELLSNKEELLDLTGLDPSKAYPVTINLRTGSDYTTEKIMCGVERPLMTSYNAATSPDYYGHSSGFMTILEWTTFQSGWGMIVVPTEWSTSDTKRYIDTFEKYWLSPSTAKVTGSIGQVVQVSTEFVYLRGGSKYRVYTSKSDAVITLHPSGVTLTYNGGSRTLSVINASDIVEPVQDRRTKEQVSSEIRQTADSISLSVRSGIESSLRETGIDIVDKIITMKAEQTIFKDLSGREMISFEMVEYDGSYLPSLVFWDNKGKKGGNKSFVLNWKGLIDMTQHSASMLWGNEVMLGTSNGNRSFANGSKIYADVLWFNKEERDGVKPSIYSVTKYMYYAGYTVVAGKKTWNPAEAGDYDGKMFDSDATSQLYLPTGTPTAGWYISEITEQETGTKVWRKIFSFTHYTGGMPDSVLSVCVDALDVYEIHGQVVSIEYQFDETLTDSSVTTGSDSLGNYMIVPTVN